VIRRAALLAALLALAAAAPARAATITMSGSSVAEALVADLAYFYGHQTPHAPRFSLTAGGTGTGLADAARGVVDAGLVSRNLIAGDPHGLVLTPLALSGVCLITNRANPVPGITFAQIQDIVAGRVTSWAQVPGSPRSDAIVPATLDQTAGARAVFDSVFVALTTPMIYTPRTFATSAQLRDFVEQTPAAFGYADLALTAPVHRLTYQGAACDRRTIRLGSYPAQRPLGVVTRGRPRGALARFLRWAAGSRTARRVVASRYVLVRR
jgi:phosphate transport system substrate-binding protein